MESITFSKKCSHCRTEGHTKRRCPLFVVHAQIASGPIPVALDTESTLSPHILSLERPKEKNIWDTVSVFSANTPPETERVAVNFAESVALFNARPKQVSNPIKQTRKSPTFSPLPVTCGVDGSTSPQVTPKAIAVKEKIGPSLSTRLKEMLANAATFCSPRDMRRYAAVTMATIIVASIPLPAVGYYQRITQTNASIVAESADGFKALQSSTVAALGADINQASTDLAIALSSFGEAERLINTNYRWLISGTQFLPVIGSHIASREHLLSAGQHLALGNTYLIKGIQAIQTEKEQSFTERLQLLKVHLVAAIPQYKAAEAELSEVEERAVPEEYRTSFHEFRLLFSTIVDDLHDVIDLADAVHLILGGDSFKRYLVVFQNPHELRATGGFIGSYAVIDVQKGKMINVDIPGGGSYDLQGQLSEHLIPPAPIQITNKRWEFQDANWFPDFAASAKKLIWFYEKSRPETIDGVIAVNATVLERFLRVVGTISASENLSLEEATALQTLQAHVESTEERDSGTPKAALTPLFSDLMAKLGLLERGDMVRLVSELHDAAEEKEVQVYMQDPSLQESLSKFGWTGEILPLSEGQDYLSVINTNIQGQKTDAEIIEEIEHQAEIQNDGSIVSTVLIRRTHKGTPDVHSLYGVQNVDYVRLYVPEGAELIEAKGFRLPPEEIFRQSESWYKRDGDLLAIEGEAEYHGESGTRITHEFGKVVFGNWIMTPPGETTEVYVVYRLPPLQQAPLETRETFVDQVKEVLLRTKGQEHRTYSLFVQKQSGTNATFHSRVVYPDGWTPVWRSDERMDLGRNGGAIHIPLTTDESFSLLMERELPTL